MTAGPVGVADNRLPLNTAGLANLLNVNSSMRSLQVWRRSNRFAAGVEGIVSGVGTLRRELDQLRDALQSGDFGDLLVKALESEPPKPVTLPSHLVP